jgi:nicotinate-nucleotide adenylyltransferase
LAEYCREQNRLDKVWFVPAAISPHKLDCRPMSAKARVEMLELAMGGHEAFGVSRIELERGGVSYTVDTLADFHDQHPTAELFFLMGADSLVDFGTWKEPGRICQLAIPVIVCRPGHSPPDYECFAPFVGSERLALIRQCQVDMPQVEISSTNIRQRVAAGKSIRFQTPRAVEKYIETQNLYRE